MYWLSHKKIKTFKLNSAAKRTGSEIVCRTGVNSGHGGTIREAGGKIAERGAVLEEEYFYKKVN